jgi:hypothetical protein|tara:strand:- start:84 stop:791 length:708 start_codon:yes stop_codon:yes gene_type:complete
VSITISLKSQNVERDVVIPIEWKDITVKYWGELSTIIKKHYTLASQEDEIREEERHELLENPLLSDLIKENPLNDSQVLKMNSDIFTYITGLTKEETSMVDVSKITQVISLINKLTEEYKPKGIRNFEFEGEEYFFPSEFFKKQTYGDFIESTQLDMYIKDMENGRFDILPEQMAILCRRTGEEYDDDLIPEKAEKFRGLTMDVIWEFSFFLTLQTERLAKLSPTYLVKQLQAQE